MDKQIVLIESVNSHPVYVKCFQESETKSAGIYFLKLVYDYCGDTAHISCPTEEERISILEKGYYKHNNYELCLINEFLGRHGENSWR